MTPRRRIIPMFVPHLGCTHDCVFCNQHRISGRSEPVTAADVKAELEKAAAQKGQYELAFYGGSFTAIPVRRQEELLGAALPFLHSGLLSGIRLSTRPDAVDDATLGRLARYGVATIELGAQSMCDEVLRASGRGHTAADTARAAASVRAWGFQLVLQMMTGLPGDTPARAEETARRLIALRPDGVRIYPTVIVENTALYELWSMGRYREHTVEDAVELCARLLPLFADAHIPVIRLGLNPTDELTGGAAIAGAYHPALGELVRARMRRREAEQMLVSVPAGTDVALGVRPGLISQLVGQHGENRRYFQERFSFKSLKIVPVDVQDDRIYLLRACKSDGDIL